MQRRFRWRGVLALACSCGHHEAAKQPAPVAALAVTSSAFVGGAAIPTVHTCEGDDLAPPLAWTGAPAGTRTFALIVDDPDAPDPAAPRMTWVHWVVADVPVTTTSLPAGGALPAAAIAGKNDFGKTAWGGPCPPIGRHRYVFKVYALDAAVGKPGITKPELIAAMAGHVLAEGELVGSYQKLQ
jgi:Raf kinase inhibitor-like YbhB/YbcL family protein